MRRGYTLVELAIVLAITAILAAIGYGSTRAYLPRYRTVRAGRQLQADIQRLRSLALSSGRETRLHLTGSGGSCEEAADEGGSWQMEIGDTSMNARVWDVLPADLAEAGADEDQSDGLVDIGPDGNRRAASVCLEKWADLVGPGTGNEDAIVFSPRGWVTNPFEDFNAKGYLVITFHNQEAAREGLQDEVSVTLARSGNVHLTTTLGGDAPTAAVGTRTASSAP